MIKYQVRSRSILDLVNEIESERLILSPYFQRNLVWRTAHKVDFIKTILLGFPFPEIFIARGGIDVEAMTATSCIVDGQQRMNSIIEYIKGDFIVDGKTYSDLPSTSKEDFLKYDIAIIELDLDSNDPTLHDIFKRLNRTFYALSAIEKMSSEFGSSEFMLMAKLLCGELMENNKKELNIAPELHTKDPNVTIGFTIWGNGQNVSAFHKFILESPIFSKYEISRQVQLMFTLNLMSTALSGYYNRNDKVTDNLEDHTDLFDNKELLLRNFNKVAAYINKLRFSVKSYWYSKSNSFSLFLCLFERIDELEKLDQSEVKRLLLDFEKSPPPDYALAAKEGVNNKKERLLRKKHIDNMLKSI